MSTEENSEAKHSVESKGLGATFPTPAVAGGGSTFRGLAPSPLRPLHAWGPNSSRDPQPSNVPILSTEVPVGGEINSSSSEAKGVASATPVNNFLPCYFGGTIANRDSENYNGDREATLICAMGGQLTLSMNVTEARLNTFTQVEYTLDEYGQIDSVYPFTVIAKPTSDELMEIGARNDYQGKDPQLPEVERRRG